MHPMAFMTAWGPGRSREFVSFIRRSPSLIHRLNSAWLKFSLPRPKTIGESAGWDDRKWTFGS